MLRHSYIRKLAVTIALLTAGLIWQSLFLWSVATIISVLLTFIVASGRIDSGFYIKAICRRDVKEPYVVLSFDDGPDKTNTPRILELLRENGIKAVFFVVGEKASQNPDIIQNADAGGHIIGNHTFSHSNMIDFYSADRFANELIKTEETVEKITGRRTRLFRPPFGVTNPNIKQAVDKLGYCTIGWSLRALDVSFGSTSASMRRIRKKIQPGDIILLHDSAPYAVELVEELIGFLKERKIVVIGIDRFTREIPYK